MNFAVCRGQSGVEGHLKINVKKGRKKLLFFLPLTETVAVCVPLKAHSTLGFRAASERALCVHAVETGPTVMALLHTLINVCKRGVGGRKRRKYACNATLHHWMAVWLNVRLHAHGKTRCVCKKKKKKKQR